MNRKEISRRELLEIAKNVGLPLLGAAALDAVTGFPNLKRLTGLTFESEPGLSTVQPTPTTERDLELETRAIGGSLEGKKEVLTLGGRTQEIMKISFQNEEVCVLSTYPSKIFNLAGNEIEAEKRFGAELDEYVVYVGNKENWVYPLLRRAPEEGAFPFFDQNTSMINWYKDGRSIKKEEALLRLNQGETLKLDNELGVYWITDSNSDERVDYIGIFGSSFWVLNHEIDEDLGESVSSGRGIINFQSRRRGLKRTFLKDEAKEKLNPLEIEKSHPELRTLRERTATLIEAIDRYGSIDAIPQPQIHRDALIMIYALSTEREAVGRVVEIAYPTPENIYSALAFHEVAFMRDEAIRKLFEDLKVSGAIERMNKLVADHVNPNLFMIEKTPTIPEDVEQYLVFSPDLDIGGLGLFKQPLLNGRSYLEFSCLTEESEQRMALRGLAALIGHESAHSFFQVFAKEPMVNFWMNEPEPRMIHTLHYLFDSIAIAGIGIDPDPPPYQLVIIHKALKEAGLDPMEKIVTTLAVGSDHIHYDEIVREHGLDVPSLFELFPDKGIPPETSQRIEELYEQGVAAFLEDFAPYVLGRDGEICRVFNGTAKDYVSSFRFTHFDICDTCDYKNYEEECENHQWIQGKAY